MSERIKRSTLRIIKEANDKLELHGQKARIVSYSKKKGVLLESGEFLEGKAGCMFLSRIFRDNPDWVNNADNLISGEVTPKSIRAVQSSIAGKKTQALYGDTIKQNLNTGVPWNKGKKTGPNGPMSEATKKKISIANSGERNGQYGKKMSDEDKKIQSDRMKQLILDGRFTPNSNNRNTHWDSEYNGKKYRSSWEALFQYIYPNAEYEKLRIPYVINNESHVYIVDFIDHGHKIIAEVKPKELCDGEIFLSKYNSLLEYAETIGYSVIIADGDWLVNNAPSDIDFSLFSEDTARKIRAIYEAAEKNRDTKT